MVTFTVIFIALITALFLVWFFSHKSREKERLLLIEKGMDLPPQPESLKFNFRFPWLKIGLVIFGMALGMTIGVLLIQVVKVDDSIVFGFIFLLGGLGMILGHYLDQEK